MRFIELSDVIADRMHAAGTSSAFVLGGKYGGDPLSNCEPHLTLFRQARSAESLPVFIDRLGEGMKNVKPVELVGREWALNPFGAVELLFDVDPKVWDAAQDCVIAAGVAVPGNAFPLFDPSGETLEELRARSNPVQRENLLRLGYEQVGEARNPHVTFAWPLDANYRYPLGELPAANSFRFAVSSVGVFRESPRHGACIECLGEASLSIANAKNPFPSFD